MIMRQFYQNDVLFGKGSESYNHAGNFAFRGLIMLNKNLYNSTNKRERLFVCKRVIQAIHAQNPPGRFLEYDSFSSSWIEMSRERTIKKTNQALKRSTQNNNDPYFSRKCNTLKMNITKNQLVNNAFKPTRVNKIDDSDLLSSDKLIEERPASTYSCLRACLLFEKTLEESCDELGVKEEDLDNMISTIFSDEEICTKLILGRNTENGERRETNVSKCTENIEKLKYSRAA